jgi:hypothetical protein
VYTRRRKGLSGVRAKGRRAQDKKRPHVTCDAQRDEKWQRSTVKVGSVHTQLSGAIMFDGRYYVAVDRASDTRKHGSVANSDRK